MITDIYRIKTQNSIYELQVQTVDIDGSSPRQISRCRKVRPAEGPWQKVNSPDAQYLEKLYIGASFKVPGVVTTSVVKDYNHLVSSSEPKRYLEQTTTIGGFFVGLAEHLIEQANGGAVMVAEPQERVYQGYGPGCSELNHVGGCTCDLPPTCTVPGCTYSSKYGPSHNGSRMCKSGSIASGGTHAHCACDYCY